MSKIISLFVKYSLLTATLMGHQLQCCCNIST